MIEWINIKDKKPKQGDECLFWIKRKHRNSEEYIIVHGRVNNIDKKGSISIHEQNYGSYHIGHNCYYFYNLDNHGLGWYSRFNNNTTLETVEKFAYINEPKKDK